MQHCTSGGGVKACYRAGFGCVDLVEKFRSLEVEKDLIIILSTKNSLCLIFVLSLRPITAPTSQVGEVAVVRTPVSYKCGWGSVKANPHPNLPQLGKECACVVQLAHSPRPLWERVEFVSEPCELRNSGEGLKNYHSNHYPPTPFGYFPRKGGRGCSVQLALNQFAVIQSPTAIQGRRISKTFSNPVTDTSKVLSSRTCFRNLPALTTSTHPNLPSREGTCAVAHLTPMPLDHLITLSLDHCPIQNKDAVNLDLPHY